MNRELTQARSTLRILGEGILIFTLWDIIRPFILMLLPQAETEATAAELPFQLSEMSEGTILLILSGIVLFSLLFIGLRLYAGLAARAEGLGRSRGWGYVVIGFLLLIAQTALFLASIWLLVKMKMMGNVLERLAFLTLEISSAAIMFEMSVTAIRFKRLREQSGKGR